MTHRFHVDEIGTSEHVRLSAETVKHLHVLGLGRGSEVVLFDGTGIEAVARIERVSGQAAEARVLKRADLSRETSLAVTLAAAVPKGRRMAVLVRMCAELGVREIVPLVTRRSVVKPDAGNKLTRWRKICTAAAEQSGRNVVTAVAPPTTFPELIGRADDFDLAVILSPDVDAPGLVDVLRSTPDATSCLLLVGPEGGFTAEERALASTHGVQPAALTRSVLRVETACVAAVTVAAVFSSR